MKLLFAYLDYACPGEGMPSYRGLGECGLNFSTNLRFEVQKKESTDGEGVTYELSRKARADGMRLPRDFWGEPIHSLTALVGENGAGKSSLLYGVIKAVVKGLDPGVPFVLVLQKTDSQELVVYHSTEMHVEAKDTPDEIAITNDYPDDLKKTKVMLVDNTLTHDSVDLDWDYSQMIRRWDSSTKSERQDGPICECRRQLYNRSLAASIRFSNEMSSFGLSDQAVGVTEALFRNLNYDAFQEIRFLFDPSQKELISRLCGESQKGDCAFAYPKYLYIGVLPVDQLMYLHPALRETYFEPHNPVLDVCRYIQEEGFFGKMLADALIILCHDIDSSLYVERFNKVLKAAADNGTGITFAEASEVTESCIKDISSFFESQPDIDQSKSATVARCCDFIRYVIKEHETLSEICMPTPENHQRNSHIYDCTVKTEEVLYRAKWLECFTGFLSRYRRIIGVVYFLSFSSGMSSGERNLLQLITHFRYMLDGPAVRFGDDDSEPDSLVNRFDASEFETKCDTLLLFFDEADLTYHPEWQRSFVYLLTKTLHEMFCDSRAVCSNGPIGCKDIQIILGTHSPLLLSDIPKQSCVFLEKKDGWIYVRNDTRIERTFGANIHELLRNAFFLKRTIGEHAYRKIKDVYDDLQNLEDYKSSQESDEDSTEYYEKLRKYREIIELVGDPVLRKKLRTQYTRACARNQLMGGVVDVGKFDCLSEKEQEKVIASLNERYDIKRRKENGESE